MDETRTTDVRFPPGRYGRRREGGKPSKLLVGGAASVFLIGGVAIGLSMYNQYGGMDYTGDVVAFDTDERHVTVTFDVHKPEGADATCVVRARSKDGAQVGNAEVSIEAEEPSVRVTYTLETSAKPVTGELLRCYPT
ncbi:MAG TPA: DUF4307 domain-containing protein [Candidatus Stackebrandtia faecavium]|nr:DUF4307 domain-containing protein [Candidatus Stackebrandtia faecavium]